VLNIVILAAGKGSRMHSSLPKVLHELAGEPLLGHVISVAKSLVQKRGGRIRVVTGHGSDQVDPFVLEQGADIVHQRQQLGTGHALQIAMDGLASEGQTLVLYGDVPLISEEDIDPLIAAGESGLAVLTAVVGDPTGYGRIIRDTTGNVVSIVEHRDASESERAISEINSGIYAAPTSLFQELLPLLTNGNAQNEYYLTDCVQLSVNSGREVYGVEGAVTATMGVNDRLQLAELNQLLQQERRNALMSAGVTLVAPETVYLNGSDIHIQPDTIIEPNVTLNSPVSIGSNVQIGFGSHLTNVVIGDGSVIKPYTVAESASVGANAQVGPFTRLRPGTELSDATHVGNFCETKNAKVGEGSKINHLSYVGDAVIGKRVNVGAGTITCNYDGAYKHQTTLGDDVFVGSNTSLIAPVTLGDGVTTGAGSVITTDVEQQHLALARSKQINIPAYQRPKKPKD
jgi:bifunctional UDP-N-acetylglucosamine pyrophosphorylase/glucosamine-1-phosphate N-acetyltransferase